jgi:hypothetical protein
MFKRERYIREFVSEIETPRNDAGYGLLMLNDKHGGLIPLDANKSGLFIPYDAKKIREIKIKDSAHIIVGANGHKVSCFKMN